MSTGAWRGGRRPPLVLGDLLVLEKPCLLGRRGLRSHLRRKHLSLLFCFRGILPLINSHLLLVGVLKTRPETRQSFKNFPPCQLVIWCLFQVVPRASHCLGGSAMAAVIGPAPRTQSPACGNTLTTNHIFFNLSTEVIAHN